jgi:hypothetical protein
MSMRLVPQHVSASVPATWLLQRGRPDAQSVIAMVALRARTKHLISHGFWERAVLLRRGGRLFMQFNGGTLSPGPLRHQDATAEESGW